MIKSIILNNKYKTKFKIIFSEEGLGMINKYSLKYQREKIFKMWIQEKEELSAVEQIIYLYEHIVFVSFFPEKEIGDKLMDFLSVEYNEESEYVFACYKILRLIKEYGGYKRSERGNETEAIYLTKASEIQQQLDRFDNVKIAPIIECVARNYLGLCYLNAYLTTVKADNGDIEQQKVNLKIERDSFEKVIEMSENNFGDRVEIFQAFARYNLARVLTNLQKDADSEYNSAIEVL